MALITTERISKRFDKLVVLREVNVRLDDRSRIALVGRNGIGKTTLLNIMAGKIKPDEGVVHRSAGLGVDCVEQELDGYNNLPLREFVSGARPDLQELTKQLREAENELEDNPGDDRRLQFYDSLQSEFQAAGGFEFDTELDISLAALGFPKSCWERKLSEFSGGEKNRAGLARALLGNGELLMLDEPTNHLDIDSTEWLERRLKTGKRGFLIISHDRRFLDEVVTSVWEFSRGKVEIYHGGFASYVTESHARRERQIRQYEKQQADIERTEDFIRRNLAGQKTKQAKSRRTQLAKVERLERPSALTDTPSISISSGGRSYNHTLEISGVSIGYDGKTLVRDINLNLYRGEKAALIGANGSGKSTLIRAILGEIATQAGTIRLGSRVEIGYFDQTLSGLEPQYTALETLWEIDQQATQGKLRSYLARFGFYGEETEKPISSFSGGEKTKLSLARLLYHPANLMIFDEPTNHLDVESREALEEALLAYDGACLLVSHDRWFLDRVTEKTFAIEDGYLHEYAGSYSYYAEKRQERLARASASNESPTDDYADFKRRSRRKSALEKKLKSTVSKIADHERELKRLEELLAEGIPKSDWERLSQTSASKSEVEMTILELYQQQEDLRVEYDSFAEEENGSGSGNRSGNEA